MPPRQQSSASQTCRRLRSGRIHVSAQDRVKPCKFWSFLTSIRLRSCHVLSSSTSSLIRGRLTSASTSAKQVTEFIYVPWQWGEQDTLKTSNGEVYPGVFQVSLYDYIALQTVLPASKCSNGIFFITFPAQALLDAARSVRSKGYTVVYDIMDDWAEFKKVGQAPWHSDILETQAVLESDIVSAVSQPLRVKFDTLRTDIQVIGNGFSPSVLGDARNVGGRTLDPHYKIVAGYFGHLTDAWFDWGAILELAASRPDILFELIGYGASDGCLQAARSLKNVSLVPPTRPSDLKKYANRWNVGLIPFKPGPLARAVDPIKIYEYLYMGLPVVVTGISHLAKYPGTCFVETSVDLASAITQQAAAQKLLQGDAAVGEFLAQATWRARFDRLISQTKEVAGMGALYEYAHFDRLQVGNFGRGRADFAQSRASACKSEI